MLKKLIASSALLLTTTAAAFAQQGQPQPFAAGMPLGVTAQGNYTPMSDNVKVYGAVVNAESCSYDETRGLIMAVNRGVNQNQVPNDGYVSLINPDGSVNTARWIGVNRNGLVLNQPFGSDVHDGKLYVADRDGGLADPAGGPATPSISVIRMFDIATGAPAGEIPVPGSTGFNDIEVAADGTIYATETGGGGQTPDPTTWKVYKVLPDGTATIIVQGEPLRQPNGIAIDGAGNIVVVNLGVDSVLTFTPDGALVSTEQAAMAGNDGIVIMEDGTKYVSSVTMGGVSRIAPGGTAELIATGVPMAASMCYDSGANQLVIPMNSNNGLAFIALD